jgi:propanol-preferring alcohol dehydrogenase
MTGWDSLCRAQHNTGYSVNGSFAEYVIGAAPYVGRLPQKCDFAEMTPILCAGVTSYKGIKDTEAKPGEWIAISGSVGLAKLRCNTPRRWACMLRRSTRPRRS